MSRPPCDVLVLGASFLGAELVYLLRNRAPALRVTVVDRQRSHGYIPLVHERLVGRLDWEGSRFRTAEFVERAGATFVHGEVIAFDPRRKQVTLAGGRTLRGRFVVIALGSVTAPPPRLPGAGCFEGHKLAAETAAARDRIARVLSPVTGREERPHAVVVGGGISGSELAGELAHLAANRPMTLRPPRVTLVNGGARLVESLSPKISDAVDARLRDQGVEILHATRVVGAEPGGVTVVDALGQRTRLPSDLAFWCGGVRPPLVLAQLGLPLTDDGWLRVDEALSCPGFGPDILSGGDCARVLDATGARWPTMQRAIEGLWAAETIAWQVVRLSREQPGYPRGIPELRRHPLRPDFFHGLSLGSRSPVVYGDWLCDLGSVNIAFRRFLMWGYLCRYGQWPHPALEALFHGQVTPRAHRHLGEAHAADAQPLRLERAEPDGLTEGDHLPRTDRL